MPAAWCPFNLRTPESLAHPLGCMLGLCQPVLGGCHGESHGHSPMYRPSSLLLAGPLGPLPVLRSLLSLRAAMWSGDLKESTCITRSL